MGYNGFLTGNVQSSGRASIFEKFSPKLPGNSTANDLLAPGQKIAYPVEYVVVAGGGGGHNNFRAGGGGAGGYRSNVFGENSGGGAPAEHPIFLEPGVYNITVGAGGSTSSDGTNSIFNSVISNGGGRAGTPGASGGSGGGGSANTSGGSGGNNFPGGTALLNVPRQGFNGGGGWRNNSNPGDSAGAGGGGAGGNGGGGGNTVGGVGGNGGVGVSSSITGTSVFRAGGGGGQGALNGLGGNGGGGNKSTNGTPNTGGGGGAYNSGGSGIVIFSIPKDVPVSFSLGITEANGGAGQVVGDNRVYSITEGTGTFTIS